MNHSTIYPVIQAALLPPKQHSCQSPCHLNNHPVTHVSQAVALSTLHSRVTLPPVRAGSQRGAVPMKRQALIEIIKPGDKGSWSLGYVLIRRLIISALSARNSILISPRSMARASSRTTRLVATTVPDVTERPRLIRRALNWC